MAKRKRNRLAVPSDEWMYAACCGACEQQGTYQSDPTTTTFSHAAQLLSQWWSDHKKGSPSCASNASVAMWMEEGSPPTIARDAWTALKILGESEGDLNRWIVATNEAKRAGASTVQIADFKVMLSAVVEELDQNRGTWATDEPAFQMITMMAPDEAKDEISRCMLLASERALSDEVPEWCEFHGVYYYPEDETHDVGTSLPTNEIRCASKWQPGGLGSPLHMLDIGDLILYPIKKDPTR